ncbi:MAG: aldehyde ferredoxin oxidoreductase C-terminal domain-containing protein [Dehalococcoidia bacterium]|jgi:aldehyde:ferredoxin oxidoreductase|nr:aldehyde ferredoxin oxidoreductase C-terminal domain-containing protein [Dehalococcoidia bacterium]MDP7200514.1 aldehyde ferredoxin oxidoreductase C-terminal domain-containing protein [Dehalococcoidia bacterium]HJN88029.1 aldehyde ferredoxin oxidoreductase C-terminal domain-containing protein [Dehalococcoidia bacterium]
MPIRGGYRPHILRIDLREETVVKEPLPSEEVLRKYVGGTGLGLYYLLRDAPQQAEATDPDAPLIIMLGPLTGTPAVNSSDWTTICFNLSIPYSAGVGHGHGFWGAFLKHAGHEGIILTGRAEKPSYLWIDDDRVEIRDATHLWGLSTRETERRLKLELGDEENISVACIGPAGEAQLPGAMVKADRNHGSGKGSPGAVMGSKNLKAIAVRGTGAVPLFDPAGLVETSAKWEENLALSAPWLQDGGMTRSYGDPWGKALRVAAKNMTDPEWGSEFAQKYVDACARWKITPQPSYNCKISCAYDVEITDGPYTGFVGSPCGGAENMEGAAAIIGVDDPNGIVIMTDYYDAMGLESGQFGTILGAVYEAYNEGILTLEDTDGLDLTWGNWESAMELIDRTIRREGIGAKLAGGTKAMPDALGGEKGLEEEMRAKVLDIKGEGVVMHDHRQFWSVFFGEIVAGTGPSIQGTGADANPRPEVGYPEKTPGVAHDTEEALGKVEPVRKTQFAKLWNDSLGVCMFGVRGVKESTDLTSKCLAQAVGWEDFSAQEALDVGERITNLMRLVYARRGFLKSDEFDISPKHLEPPPAGPSKGLSIEPYLPAMVDEYYRLLGWNVDTGLPTPETLKRLGMEEFLGDVS